MPACRGVDVSSFQGPQDWAAHKGAGVVFAWAKASEGQLSRDQRFDSHIGGIIRAGLVPGAYHFAWPNQDPVIEANNYIGAVRPYAGAHDFVHWLDLERYPDGRNYAGRTDTQILAYTRTWLARVQAAFPRQRVGVYTSRDDIARGHLPDGVPLWYPQYPWGEASYERAEAAPQPRPYDRQPLFWQFTSEPLDRSICYLSADGLRAWAAGEMENDMAFTKADLETFEGTDGVFLAPKDAADYSDDPASPDHYWSFGSHVNDNTTRIRRVDKALAALAAKVDGLSGVTFTDAQLAALAEKLAANPALAEALAEAVADKLAARLQS